MDTHIPEGMQPMLHPHKRKFASQEAEGNPIEVVLDRSLGRARQLPNKVPELRRGLLTTFRKLMRSSA